MLRIYLYDTSKTDPKAGKDKPQAGSQGCTEADTERHTKRGDDPCQRKAS